MNRRRILLMSAAIVAAIGAALVFLYVRGAEDRAEDKFDTVEVLVASQQIQAGEAANDAYASGKIVLKAVPQDQVLAGATANGESFTDLVALGNIYVGEQLIPEKFGGATEVQTEASLPIPEGNMAISVNLTDTARVAGFVNPGSEVAIFHTELGTKTQLLLDTGDGDRRRLDHPGHHDDHRPRGRADGRAAAAHAAHAVAGPEGRWRRCCCRRPRVSSPSAS